MFATAGCSAINFSVILYYITDRQQFAGDKNDRRQALLHKIAEASRCGVDFIQLREKDLCTRDLESLARAAAAAIRKNSQQTCLLINSRSDVAMACGADGVHLRGDDLSPSEVRKIRPGPGPLIGVSCHSAVDVGRAASEGADFVVFAPVFEKKGDANAQLKGLGALRAGCKQGIRVLALGGVTLTNANQCMEAGAAGVAGIRLFQENDVSEVVRALRG